MTTRSVIHPLTSLLLRALSTLAACLPALAPPQHARAQPLAADRPDFTEASSTVGRGVLQFELGYTFGTNDADGAATRAHSFGEPLLRYGVLTDRIELRLGAGATTQSTTIPALSGRTSTNSGLEDLYLGIKAALTEQRGIVPETAILPQITVPIGAEEFSAGRALPGVNLLYSWDLAGAASLAGSTQVNAAGPSGAGHLEWSQSAALGASLGARIGIYGEWYAIAPSGSAAALTPEGSQTEHYLNGGLAFLQSDDLQWDIRAGVGLSDAAQDMFAGAGVAIRVR